MISSECFLAFKLLVNKHPLFGYMYFIVILKFKRYFVYVTSVTSKTSLVANAFCNSYDVLH